MRSNESKPRKPDRDRFYGADLAALHNQHYSDFVAQAAPQVVTMLRSAGIRNGLVCDLGCGGGQLSSHLLKAGHPVVGVDISRAMISIARRQVPQARFMVGSISDTKFPDCAAAIAIGEVFNYLNSPKKMDQAFRNVFHSLHPGGLLIFDIKEPLSNNKTINRVSCRSGSSWAVLAEIEEDPFRNRLVRKICGFVKSGHSYRRHDETHELAIYKASKIATMLRSIGFRVSIRRGYGRYRLPPDRKVLVARKPNKR